MLRIAPEKMNSYPLKESLNLLPELKILNLKLTRDINETKYHFHLDNVVNGGRYFRNESYQLEALSTVLLNFV
ncbi:hypothetical protein QYM39_00385 [Pediococcus pentosaceus]|uniref:hypothetical protein n=1 Tax=Pediococcus pentosaceus TaxID=1255 RepID=UPI00265B5F75|nr:hypothetical protein [Pediococcus pentosaceus]WKF71158.1 hypothetical protein QYM39_00385 [Pediococcus pentosaceus]